MKKKFQHIKLFLPALLMLTSLSSHAQQEFTLTTTTANTSSSKALIDMPGLTGNGNAIIIATQTGITSNPHPTGAWYYQGKWNIFNSNHAALAMGLTYKVTYFLSPGPNQFVHVMTQQNIGTQGSYIDNTALNNNPNAQFTIFQNHAPEIRTGALNSFATKTGYSTASGKWYITNTGNQPLMKGSAYNIVISSATSSLGSSTSPPNNSSTDVCICPTSLPPNGNAGGDLSGTYPNPAVQKLLGRPLSITAPATGQVLKWNGTAWEPGNDNGGSTGGGATYTAGTGLSLTGTTFSASSAAPIWNANKIMGVDILKTAPTAGQVLKFGGGSWSPADDNVGAGGAGNGWNTSGNNISNTNTGNVGIGNNNPAYQLDISNRMRIRGGVNLPAGIWLSDEFGGEAALIGMADNSTVGFYGKGGILGVTGWKFKMNCETGDVYMHRNVGIGTNPSILSPLSFAPINGDKISLFPGASGTLDRYGLGIQGSLLQIHTDGAASDIAFGYGSSAYFTEKMRIKGNGNVGIGNINPAYQLDVSNRMRIRSGGNNSVSAGIWLNNNANTEAAFIGMEDDTHVGFFGNPGAGWKFSMNTQTGALKINGSEGTAGQVLTSNGAGSPPSWTQLGGGTTAAAAPMQTFFKADNEQSPLLGMNGNYTFTTHTYPITVTKNSRLIISGSFEFRSGANHLDVYSTKMGLVLLVNGVGNGTLCYEEMAPRTSVTASFSNYMIDVGPGTHSIQFKVNHPWIDGNVAGYALTNYTSIIVIPQ